MELNRDVICSLAEQLASFQSLTFAANAVQFLELMKMLLQFCSGPIQCAQRVNIMEPWKRWTSNCRVFTCANNCLIDPWGDQSASRLDVFVTWWANFMCCTWICSNLDSLHQTSPFLVSRSTESTGWAPWPTDVFLFLFEQTASGGWHWEGADSSIEVRQAVNWPERWSFLVSALVFRVNNVSQQLMPSTHNVSWPTGDPPHLATMKPMAFHAPAVLSFDGDTHR